MRVCRTDAEITQIVATLDEGLESVANEIARLGSAPAPTHIENGKPGPQMGVFDHD